MSDLPIVTADWTDSATAAAAAAVNASFASSVMSQDDGESLTSGSRELEVTDCIFDISEDDDMDDASSEEERHDGEMRGEEEEFEGYSYSPLCSGV
jgi:hypothetical protein